MQTVGPHLGQPSQVAEFLPLPRPLLAAMVPILFSVAVLALLVAVVAIVVPIVN